MDDRGMKAQHWHRLVKTISGSAWNIIGRNFSLLILNCTSTPLGGGAVCRVLVAAHCDTIALHLCLQCCEAALIHCTATSRVHSHTTCNTTTITKVVIDSLSSSFLGLANCTVPLSSPQSLPLPHSTSLFRVVSHIPFPSPRDGAAG